MFLRRIIAIGLVAQHGIRGGEEHQPVRRRQSATGNLAALGIPRLLGTLGGVGKQPSLGGIALSAGGHHCVEDALLGGGIGFDLFALRHQRHGGGVADQARQALGAAPAGKQTQRGFGQAKARFWVIGRDTVMADHGDFQPASQGRPGHGAGDRLAGGFKAAASDMKSLSPVEHLLCAGHAE